MTWLVRQWRRLASWWRAGARPDYHQHPPGGGDGSRWQAGARKSAGPGSAGMP